MHSVTVNPKKKKDRKSGIKVQVCFSNYHQPAKKHLSLFSQILRDLTSRQGVVINDRQLFSELKIDLKTNNF